MAFLRQCLLELRTRQGESDTMPLDLPAEHPAPLRERMVQGLHAALSSEWASEASQGKSDPFDDAKARR